MNSAILPRLHTSHDCALCVSLLSLVVAGVCSPAMAQDDVFGRWDEPEPLDGDYSWEVRAIHAAHLPTGRILVWENRQPLFPPPDQPDDEPPRLWNPTDGGFTPVLTEVDFWLFCSGHAALSDGSILVAGGGRFIDANDETIIFRLTGKGPWEQVANMNSRRWYPTCTSLSDGRVLAVSGQGDITASIPEIYDPLAVGPQGTPGMWTELMASADKVLPLYPFMFVLPQENKVFFAGGGSIPGDGTENTFVLDTLAETWSGAIPSQFSGLRGSAVMYEPGKVLKSGGNFDVDGDGFEEVISKTATIDVTDVNDPLLQWVSTFDMDMEHARRWHNLVLLPTGQILALGGENNCPPFPCDPVFAAEWFDPELPVPVWQPLAEMTRPRGDHSTAVLLRDGRVLVCGGEDFDPPHFSSQSAEIFSPPYLFTGQDRPVIGFAPTTISYGQDFNMTAKLLGPGGSVIEKVTLVRLAAVTHSFDQNQRFVKLNIVAQAGSRLRVSAPANGNIAPPGYYMLFVVTNFGVPSVGEYILVQ